MPDERILRAKAREAIRTGKLPSRRPDRTWAGPGINNSCTICGAPIKLNQVEFEIQFAHDGTAPCSPPLLRGLGVRAPTGWNRAQLALDHP